jgi:17beta-estradiol 17-dehydrogenase / very-long-chain 3-oxoacyl-CoA reductase
MIAFRKMIEILNSESAEKFFQYFGLTMFSFITLKYVLKVIKNVYTFTFGGINLKKYGDWAVATGCTDGIGKAYAEKLAKKGLNIVLLSRSLDKLNELSIFITEKYKVKTKVIAVDFTGELLLINSL